MTKQERMDKKSAVFRLALSSFAAEHSYVGYSVGWYIMDNVWRYRMSGDMQGIVVEIDEAGEEARVLKQGALLGRAVTSIGLTRIVSRELNIIEAGQNM